jgi:predicted DNA-binding protein
MSRKKISTTIYVTPEQSERLRLLHERTKVPVAVYIREGIDLVLRQYGHLLPGQLTLASEQAATAQATSAASLGAVRADVEPKPSTLRQERAAAAAVVEPMPERAAGGAGGKS